MNSHSAPPQTFPLSDSRSRWPHSEIGPLRIAGSARNRVRHIATRVERYALINSAMLGLEPNDVAWRLLERLRKRSEARCRYGGQRDLWQC